ncbi:hypothetical protein M9H77_23205 [Catharanthus roseus]|uniref:Uncharacterized protein n=1 Tax=Catharanthus roseus TaxID=4058 RepID=A0ACC0ASA3_CATRO|nr:hypothetical protein M9H77_23205 [Catharanthus roseus]
MVAYMAEALKSKLEGFEGQERASKLFSMCSISLEEEHPTANGTPTPTVPDRLLLTQHLEDHVLPSTVGHTLPSPIHIKEDRERLKFNQRRMKWQKVNMLKRKKYNYDISSTFVEESFIMKKSKEKIASEREQEKRRERNESESGLEENERTREKLSKELFEGKNEEIISKNEIDFARSEVSYMSRLPSFPILVEPYFLALGFVVYRIQLFIINSTRLVVNILRRGYDMKTTNDYSTRSIRATSGIRGLKILGLNASNEEFQIQIEGLEEFMRYLRLIKVIKSSMEYN